MASASALKERRFPVLNAFLKILKVFLLLALVAYVASYLVLSRRGMEEARKHKFIAYFFVRPRGYSDRDLSLHYKLVSFYSPLIAVDNMLGTRPPPCTGVALSLGKPEVDEPLSDGSLPLGGEEKPPIQKGASNRKGTQN